MLVAYSAFDPNEPVATPDATVIVPTNKLMNIIIYLTKLLNRGPKKINTGGILTHELPQMRHTTDLYLSDTPNC